ncbi:MAG: hypothetical protein WD038_04810 [Balneolales bacterium]
MNFRFDVLLPVLLGGYLFIRFSPLFYYTHYRLDTQRIVFNSLLGSFFFFIPAVYLVKYEKLDAGFISFLQNYDIEYLEYSVIAFLLSITALSVTYSPIATGKVLPAFKSFILHILFFRAVYKDNDGVEIIFADAMKRTLYVCVTLKNDKVYVGSVVSSFGSPSFDTRSIRILPYASGYREPRDKSIKFITFYDELYSEIRSNPDKYTISRDDFEIAFHLRDLLTVSFFDPKIFLKNSEKPENILSNES